jgi:hypothetical protein
VVSRFSTANASFDLNFAQRLRFGLLITAPRGLHLIVEQPFVSGSAGLVARQRQFARARFRSSRCKRTLTNTALSC